MIISKIGCPWRPKLRLHTAIFGCCLVLLSLAGCQAKNSDSQQPARGDTAASAPAASAPAASALAQRAVHYVPRAFEIPVATNPGYVGYQQCVECHAERVAECVGTSHFLACRPPTADRMPAAFTSADVADRKLVLPGSPVEFEMGVEDGKYLQTATVTATNQSFRSTIDLIYGAKSISDEVYLSWHTDGVMRELPVAWIHAKDCWGAAGFNRTGGTDFARDLTVRCFECHNTWFEHVPGTLGTYRRDNLLMGVTCERCHGPAQDHVTFHREHPQAREPHAILYPGSLDRERLIEVCTQCHSNAIRHRGPALNYRPGQVLAEHYRAVAPKYNEDDHVANQITPLRESKCFQQSQMTCIACHDPHITDGAPHGMTFRESCLECHQPAACTMHEKLPAPVADKCVDCHMRKYVKINVNFDLADDAYMPPASRTDHRIAVDPVATNEVLLRWYRTQAGEENAVQASQLVEQLSSHWYQAAEQRAQQGRFTAASAAMREILRFDPESAEATSRLQGYNQQQRQFDDLLALAEQNMRTALDDQAIDLFSQVLKIRPDNATALGRLGSLYAKRADRPKAVDFYQRAIQANPDDQYGVSMMAWLELNDGNYERAAKLYEQADAIEPFNSKLNQLWGTALLKAGQVDLAVARLAVAQQSDPRNLDAIRLLVEGHLQLRNFEQAAHWAQLAAQLTEHQSLRDLMVLAECQVAQGEKLMAADVIQLALAVAAKTNPALVAEIGQWATANDVRLPPSN